MLFPRNFAKAIYMQMLEGGKDDITDANYPASTGYVDTNGYDHVCFLVGLDTIATPDFAVYKDTSATETANIAAVSGASKTDVVTGDDGKWFTIEFPVAALAPTATLAFRYITLKVSGTAGGDKANIWLFMYRSREVPVTQHTNFLEAVILGG